MLRRMTFCVGVLALLGGAFGCARPATTEPANGDGRAGRGTGGGGTGAGGSGTGGGDAGRGGNTAGRGGSEAPGEFLPPIETICPGAEGMVGAELSDGTCFKIDALPVTRGEYFEWASRVDRVEAARVYEESVRCPTELGYSALGPHIYRTSDPEGAPEERGSPCEPGPLEMAWPPPEAQRALPMYCVSWCQAAVYCEMNGKRLCRSEVVRSDPNSDTGWRPLTDASRNEWYAACSAAGSRPFPYGTGPRVDACWGALGQPGDRWDQTNAEVLREPESFPNCEGGYRGLRVMGVLREWTGTCKDRYGHSNAEPEFDPRDGSYCTLSDPFSRHAYRSCSSFGKEPASGATDFATLGYDGISEVAFRCCSD